MYGLPQRTETNKPLHKTKIFEKFAFTAAQREAFDVDVSRMVISHVIAESTIPTIKAGKEITDFYVITVQMKRKEYDAKNITLLTKLIPRKILLILQYEEQVQFAIWHTKLITTDWLFLTPDSSFLTLKGLDLDAVWENIVKSIGHIEVESGNTLTEQIAVNDQRAKLLAQVAILERKMAAEKQPRRKRDLFEQIKLLKSSVV